MQLPTRVVVKNVVSGRYGEGQRPVSWDRRKAGFETIEIQNGARLELASSGGQSTPAPGWELLLTGAVPGSARDAYQWTLYGILTLGGSTAMHHGSSNSNSDESVCLKIVYPETAKNAQESILHHGSNLYIGRSSSNDLVIDHPSVSRKHALLSWQGEAITVCDLGSRNGTKLNHQLITGTKTTTVGDCVELSDVKLYLVANDRPVPERQFTHDSSGKSSVKANSKVQQSLESAADITQHFSISERAWRSEKQRVRLVFEKIGFLVLGTIVGAVVAIMFGKYFV